MADTETENGFHDDLSPELRERAAKYAQEDPTTRDIFFEELQPSLSASGIPTDVCLMLRFLRACEFRMKQTSECMKAFYKYKANNPEWFTPLTMQEASDIIYSGVIGVLPGRDVQGGKVLYIKLGMWDPERTPMMQLFRLAISLQLQLIQDPETQIGGFRTLEDMDGLSWKHLRLFSIPEMRKMSKFYEESFPARFDGLHSINESPVFDRLFTLVKPFLTRRLIKRNHFHGFAFEDLYEYIPQENLPECYGGGISDKEIQAYTMSLVEGYKGDDFGDTTELKISKMEDKIARDTVVAASASGTYKSLGIS